jgi:hypothetical protein
MIPFILGRNKEEKARYIPMHVKTEEAQTVNSP